MGLFGPPDIKKLKTKKNVKGLVNALKHKDSKIRCEAAYALADAVEDAEDTGTREALTGAMEDQADEVRKAANSSLRDLEWYEPDPADVGEAKRLVAELQCGDQARISTAVAGILEHVRVTVRGYGDFNPQDDIGYELEKILCPPLRRSQGCTISGRHVSKLTNSLPSCY